MTPYAIRIIALLASAVGKTIVKSPLVDVLSPPKAKTATAGSPDALSLKINAPLAVIEEDENVKSLKSPSAVVPLDVGVILVRADLLRYSLSQKLHRDV